MAAPDQLEAADILKNLSLDSHASAAAAAFEPTKKIPLNDTPVLSHLDSTFCYNASHPAPYYYGGYDINDFGHGYGNPDGADMASGVYGDNGSLMYHNGYGFPSYAPYSPATSPVPTLGNDGQLYGAQKYQYSPYFQQLTSTSGAYTPNPAAAPQVELPASGVAKQKPSSVEGIKGKPSGGGFKVNIGATPFKPTYQSSPFTSSGSLGKGGVPGRIPASNYQDPRWGFDGMQSSMPCVDGQQRLVNAFTPFSNNSSELQNYLSNPHYMGLNHPRHMSGVGNTNELANRKVYGQYGNRYTPGFGASLYDSRRMALDKYNRQRGRFNGYFSSSIDNVNALNEINRGPRAKGYIQNEKGFENKSNFIGEQEKETTKEEKDRNSFLAPGREQFNEADFPEVLSDAKFFVIKSYSEDDVHKSIKYNVWASTSNGNKKLDAAFQEAEQKPGGCPVFLFFSVNASGQFVGLAEMVGAVDYLKDVEYWQQNKWIGSFPVKWHIIKDVPNSLLRHITLENNENKPVTNSRDTQEVKSEKGLEMMKIFKSHNSKTCMLDDFVFYEGRQKAMQQQKTVTVELENGGMKSVEVASDVIIKEPTFENGFVANGIADAH